MEVKVSTQNQNKTLENWALNSEIDLELVNLSKRDRSKILLSS